MSSPRVLLDRALEIARLPIVAAISRWQAKVREPGLGRWVLGDNMVRIYSAPRPPVPDQYPRRCIARVASRRFARSVRPRTRSSKNGPTTRVRSHRTVTLAAHRKPPHPPPPRMPPLCSGTRQSATAWRRVSFGIANANAVTGHRPTGAPRSTVDGKTKQLVRDRPKGSQQRAPRRRTPVGTRFRNDVARSAGRPPCAERADRTPVEPAVCRDQGTGCGWPGRSFSRGMLVVARGSACAEDAVSVLPRM